MDESPSVPSDGAEVRTNGLLSFQKEELNLSHYTCFQTPMDRPACPGINRMQTTTTDRWVSVKEVKPSWIQSDHKC